MTAAARCGTLAAAAIGYLVQMGERRFSADEPTITVVGAPADPDSRSRDAPAPKLAAERYIVIATAADGESRTVVRAYDAWLRREIALKKVQLEELSEHVRDEMLREAQALAKLSHPNVVAVYDVDTERGLIAMEYVRGATLEQWLGQGHAWRAIVATFIAAGQGLAAAHAAGLLHRDFKAASVLIGDDGRVCVSGFGAAAFALAPNTEGLSANDPPKQRELTANAPPIAPEQHEDAALTPAVDQYAFCVALWQALTGKPFTDASWPRETHVPGRLRRALQKGLSTRPEERFASMDALLGTLRQISSRAAGRRLTAAATVVAVTSVSALAWSAHRQVLAERCSGAHAQIEAVWNERDRQTIHAAFLASEVGYAADQWSRLERSLGEHASAWKAMHEETCAATTIRHERSSEDMDLAMGCLERARVELGASVQVLKHADAGVVENAHALVERLSDLERCADLEALRADVAPPAPALRDAVDAIRVELAEVEALHDAGKYAEAVSLAEPLLARARVVEYPPLHTEAMLVLGGTQASAGMIDEAQATLAAGLRSAMIHAQWRQAMDAATLLTAALTAVEPRKALIYAETARGLGRHSDAEAEATLRTHIGATLSFIGRFAEAEVELRAALAIGKQVWSRDPDALSSLHLQLGMNLIVQGRLDEAEEEVRVQLELRQSALAPDHPRLTEARAALAIVLAQRGKFADAEREYAAVVTSAVHSLGAQHPTTAIYRLGYGQVLYQQGELEAALAELTAASQVFEEQDPEQGVALATLMVSSSVLNDLGRSAEAEPHLRRALFLSERLYGSADPRIAATRSSLAISLMRQGRLQEAEAEARASISAYLESTDLPSRAVSHNTLALVLRSSGRLQEAETESRTALELVSAEHPFYPMLRNTLGTVLEARGRYEEAEAVQREALAAQLQQPNPAPLRVAWTRSYRASALRALGRRDEALDEYREALRLLSAGQSNPQVERARHTIGAGLGRTLVEVGRGSEALPLLERAWEALQDDPATPTAARGQLAFALARAVVQTDRMRATSLAQSAQSLLSLTPRAYQRDQVDLAAWQRAHR